MKGSLAVEQAEMLQIIEHLERVITGLQDEDAEVSKYADELHRLRKQILRARSPTKWHQLGNVALDLVTRIAVELLKTWL